MYKLVMGLAMREFYDGLKRKIDEGIANADERKLWKQLGKTFRLLSENPKHPGLRSHKIEELKQRYPSDDIWESYVENHTPKAKRIFWTYEPDGFICIHAIELHPEKARDYKTIERKFKTQAEGEQ